MKALLTGGAGYIGSHTAVALIEAGFDVVVLDNYVNSSPESIARVEKITGKTIKVYEGDLREDKVIDEVFEKESIDVVLHFAGLKAVGESIDRPIEYYRNNVCATITLLASMKRNNVHNIVFSSSATVYGKENEPPYTEDMPRGCCSSPYGWSKSMIEQVLIDSARADSELRAVILRYFNPVGAHESGLIGEDPKGIPNNLMPYISQVAAGTRKQLIVFGDDYDTEDGTCLRDYIHVMDLAEGHVNAIYYLFEMLGGNTEIFNLGTGIPQSVLEVVRSFENVCGKQIDYQIGPRRQGDISVMYTSPTKAKEKLKWTATRTLGEMCQDAWRWQKNNPGGYN